MAKQQEDEDGLGDKLSQDPKDQEKKAAIAAAQKVLVLLSGSNEELLRQEYSDGIYGPATKRAIRALQHDLGLNPNDEFTPAMFYQLQLALAELFKAVLEEGPNKASQKIGSA